MAARTKRNFIAFDIEQKYVDMANKRCGYIFQTPTFDFE
jgi:DNA modification methylase